MSAVEFVVKGKAEPGGSKQPGRTGDGRMFVRDDNRNVKEWKQAVAHEARRAAVGLLDGPLRLHLRFVVRRPSGHYNSRGELNAEGRRWPYPAKRPDLTKLERAVEDALKGIVWRDDGQVVQKATWKVYAERDEQARCEVAVERVPFALARAEVPAASAGSGPPSDPTAPSTASSSSGP